MVKDTYMHTNHEGMTRTHAHTCTRTRFSFCHFRIIHADSVIGDEDKFDQFFYIKRRADLFIDCVALKSYGDILYGFIRTLHPGPLSRFLFSAFSH